MQQIASKMLLLVPAAAAMLACSGSGSVAALPDAADTHADGTLPPADAGELAEHTSPEALDLEEGAAPDGKDADASGDAADAAACRTASLAIPSLDIDGQGTSAVAAAGQKLPVVLRWEAVGLPDCPFCPRQVLLGIEQSAMMCVEAMPAPGCASHASGCDVGYLEAPAEPGEYAVLAAAIDAASCAAAAPEFPHAAVTLSAGTILVQEACAAKKCSELMHECGVWDDGCGGTQFCGLCAAGLVCAPDGKCIPDTPCALGSFEVTGMLFGGPAVTGTVPPAADVPVFFSWKLANAESAPDAARQVVLRVEKSPQVCLEAGYPPVCPAAAMDLGSGHLTAPLLPGTYTVYASAPAAETCSDVTPLDLLQSPTVPVGMLTVSGGCTPATCQDMQHDCGYWPDGCGSLLPCGTCEPDKFCTTEGLCGSQPDCQAGLFEVTAAQVAAGSNSTVVGPGQKVPVAFVWKVGNPQACPHCPTQVVVGLEDVPAFCSEVTPTSACPQWSTGYAAGFVPAPDAEGTYQVAAAAVQADSCDDAIDAFPDAARLPVATVAVVAPCAPSTCATFGKQCGDWGDGCGGQLHCGTCPAAKTCNAQGTCEGACASGITELSAASINGSGWAASAAAGQSFPVSVAWTIGNPESLATSPRQLVVGVGDTAGFCSELGIPKACPGTTSGTASGTLKAPWASGAWPVYAAAPQAADCDAAMAAFADQLDRVKIGVLNVPAGCQPASCLTMGHECGEWDDGCQFTLDCGGCPGPDICNPSGTCSCSAADPYEPNNQPADAFYLGAFTDHDGSSSQTIVAALKDEADWFKLDSADVSWAFMEPYAHAKLDSGGPFTLTVVYVCTDLSMPDPTNVTQTGCEWTDGIDFTGVAGLPGTASGFVCDSGGLPVEVQFGPKCEFIDDSGVLYVGISATGPCSGYEVNLHL